VPITRKTHDLHEFPRTPAGILQASLIIFALLTLCVASGQQRSQFGSLGIIWDNMGFHGSQWILKEEQGIALDCCGR